MTKSASRTQDSNLENQPSSQQMPQDSLSTIQMDGKERYFEPAPTDISVENFKKVVTSRRSVRKFTSTQIPKAILDDCLDMALLAPNSSNLQPWTFYVVRSPEKKSKLVTACMSQLRPKLRLN